MKTPFIPIIILLLTLVGCQREITLKVDDAPQRIVVQANLSSEGETIEVRLNRTMPLYGSSGNMPKVSAAHVYIKDMTSGQILILTEGNEMYTASEPFYAVANSPYMLVVDLGETVLQSECFMPQKVIHDSLAIEKYVNAQSLKDTTYAIVLRFTDIPNQANYYKIQTFINGVVVPDINIINDNFRDGQQIKVSIKDDRFKKGSAVRLELQHISPEIYNYYFTMRQSMSGMSDAPANPPTNIFGDAIGYFSAYGLHLMEFKIN